jgi:hypothetical protein
MNTDPPVPPIYPIPNIENFGELCSNVGGFCEPIESESVEGGTVFKCVKENRISRPKCVAQYSDTMWRPGSQSGDYGLPRAGGLTSTNSVRNTMLGTELTSDESQANMYNNNNTSTSTVNL